MYADNSLTPREAIRLCALGTLAQSMNEGPMAYDDLVYAVRHFVSRITGPSLELMGESVELLKYEGLVANTDGEDAPNPRLEITEEGMVVLKTLLLANVRASTSDLNELIMALKFRFLHLLPLEDQKMQAGSFIDICDTELARLDDLLGHHKDDGGHLSEWLKHDIERLQSRLEWLTSFRSQLDED